MVTFSFMGSKVNISYQNSPKSLEAVILSSQNLKNAQKYSSKLHNILQSFKISLKDIFSAVWPGLNQPMVQNTHRGKKKIQFQQTSGKELTAKEGRYLAQRRAGVREEVTVYVGRYFCILVTLPHHAPSHLGGSEEKCIINLLRRSGTVAAKIMQE